MDDPQEQSKQYFEELVKMHGIKSGALENPSFKEIHSNIIYELLQNADDAKATDAFFELHNDKLVFRHNGSRSFTISDPKTEDEDSKNGKLGDINAITSINNFIKSEMKIWKIGIGFKTVFQYTITPMIYSATFRFQINQFILPGLINKDYLDRKPDETIFVIPFNNPDRTSTESYTDISEKLNNLTFPTLFLKTLTNVSYIISDTKTEVKFEKSIEKSQNFNDIKVELINVTNQKGKKQIWLFSQQIDSIYTISVGFFVDEKGSLIPFESELNCFFPIKEKTGLNFMINAPFLLESNCEEINEKNSHNNRMLNKLANLAAKSILLFKEIGKVNNVRLIDDNILQIIPTTYSSSSFAINLHLKPKTISNDLFYYAIQKVFQTEEIIPTLDGYISKENAYFSCDQDLINLLDHDRFVLLVKNQNAKWVFTSLSQDKQKGMSYSSYIGSIVKANINENTLLKQNGTSNFTWPNTFPTFSFTRAFAGLANNSSNSNTSSGSSGFASNNSSVASSSCQPFENNLNNSSKIDFICPSSTNSSSNSKSSSFNGIEAEFIEKQSFEWLHKFYKWIGDDNERIKKAKYTPIFITSKGKAMSAFNNSSGNRQLFFPSDQNNETINPKLIENRETLIFAKKVGLTVPKVSEDILKNIVPKYDNEGYMDTFQDFKKMFFFFKFCSYEEESSFIQGIQKLKFIVYFTREGRKADRDEACNLYFPSPFLFDYFQHLPHKKYIAIDQYKEMVEKEDEPFLLDFFEKLGVSKNVRLENFEINDDTIKKYKLPVPYYTRYCMMNEYRIEEFDYIWKLIKDDPKKSIILWNVLLNMSKNIDMRRLSFYTRVHFYYTEHTVNFPSIFRRILMNTKWLLTNKNELVAPSEIFLKELPQEFHVNDEDTVPLCNFLNIKCRDVELVTQEISDNNDFVQRLIKAGLYEKFKKELEEKEKEMNQNKK
ncbi:hypothetical protein M9Y10_015756 [Tritrichomonas musculus]|uniref:Uncharacterized protein n=1 Tax=Tritrichomonas musculus TaxID=1915356 RepID=A0ABR2I5I7_9EUKA